MEYNTDLFYNAPIATAIIKKENLVLDMANPAMLKIWKRNDAVVGMKLFDFLPEIISQPYPEIIEYVMTAGKFYRESGAKVMISNAGKMETIYMDYSYTPIFGDMQKPSAILVMATDICEREINRLSLQESSRNLHALVTSAPVAMCVFRGEKLKLDIVNSAMLDLWQCKRKFGLKALQHVFYHGLPYTLEDDHIRYSYTPLRDGTGKTTGVIVVGNKL